MKAKTFTRSIQFLIITMLAIMAFFRGPHSQWLIIGTVGIWALFILTTLSITGSNSIKEKIAKLIANRPKRPKKKAKSFIVPEIADSPEKILLRHVNCRITDKLKSAYPDATWEWCEETPVKLATKGGTGRIKTTETGEYNYADVTIDQYARIKFNMMKIVSLDDAVASEGAVAPTKTEAEPVVDVEVWYDLMGRDVLQEIITELNAHGHSYLVIKELGEVCVVDGEGKETKLEELENLPKKKWWSELAKVFCDNGLKPSVEEDRIILSW